MAAAKATTAPSPTLHDLAGEIQRQVSRAQSELADARSRLAELRGQRGALLAAPLHHSDLEGELARHIEKKGREAIDFVRLTVQEMRDRTGALATTAPGSLAAYDPFDKQWLPQVCALLADPEAAAARIMAAVGADLDTTVAAGLPIAERRAAVAKLDEQIAAGEQTESALIQGLQAAGIRIAMPNDPIPEPRPGDEKIVGGELCRWISFTGFAGTFGWFPISRLARGESEAA